MVGARLERPECLAEKLARFLRVMRVSEGEEEGVVRDIRLFQRALAAPGWKVD